MSTKSSSIFNSSSKKMIRLVFSIFLMGVVIIQLSGRLRMLHDFLLFTYEKWNEKPLVMKKVEWLAEFQSVATSPDAKKKGPNILLIVADDLGINDLSGGAGIMTPNIDSIALNGLNFTAAYSAQATCAPSRAALMTGRMPTSFGFEYTPIPNWMARAFAIRKPLGSPQPIFHDDLLSYVPPLSRIHIPNDIPTLAEILKSKFNYQNYHIGKWDSGYTLDQSPIRRGYDEAVSFLQGGSLYAPVGHPDIVEVKNIAFDKILKAVLSFELSHNNGDPFVPDEYLTDYFGKQSAALLDKLHESNSSNPWFLSVAFTAPHNPFQALKSDYKHPDIQKIPSEIGRIYAAMILALDRNVGKIIKKLKEIGEYENTIIIFTSDNGAASYAGLAHVNYPFRGFKGTLFEGGIHIPLFVQWKGQILQQFEGTKVSDMTNHIDLAPSLINIIQSLSQDNGNDNNSNQVQSLSSFDGVDVLSRFLSQQSEKKSESMMLIKKDYSDRIFYWRNGNYHAMRYQSYKFQVHLILKKIWFFDLNVDWKEQNNLFPVLSSFFVNQSQHHTFSELVYDHGLTSFENIFFHLLSNKFLPPIAVTSPSLRTQNSSIHLENLQKFNESIRIILSNYESLPKESKEMIPYNELLPLFLTISQKLVEYHFHQSSPLWPSLVDVPICIDKAVLTRSPCTLEDEYVYLAN